MCGIAGVAGFGDGFDPTPAQLQRMCDTLVHRGPDGQGLEVRDRIGLGMRRLSIIDIEGGAQPLLNEDRTVRVVFNGEIYNFRELREDLERRGHRFSTRTDGEVIVHLWEDHGPDLLSRLYGMFAIALLYTRRRQLLLARDRLGIKPLFFSLSPQGVVFASEIKALLASGLVDRTLDPDGLAQFLAWEYVPGPSTLFAGIHKLEAGHRMPIDLDGDQIRTDCWWDVATTPASVADDGFESLVDWEDADHQTITRAVRRQLVSDVPLGAFLSGGVDSSLVVHAMGPAKSFAIGFDDPSYDETPWSSAVAEHLGIDHRIEILRPEILELFDRLMPFLDDPIGDFSIFPTFLISRFARQEVTVVLTGDGGDEVFGGYETYMAELLSQRWSRIPAVVRRRLLEPLMLALPPRPIKKGLINKARRFAEGVRYEAALGHARWRLFTDETLLSDLLTPEIAEQVEVPLGSHILGLRSRAGRRSAVDQGLYIDLKSYLVDNCIVKVDRMSMANSLEARVPLLDHELVELAFQMPSEYKVRPRETKHLLKRVASRHVPRACVYRPKEGFSIPIKNWLATSLRPVMDDLLSAERLARQRIFQVATVERLVAEHLDQRANHSHVLWSLLVFQDWLDRWGAR